MTGSRKFSSLVATACIFTALPTFGQEVPSGSLESPAPQAEPSRSQCLDAHTQAQIRRMDGALLEASELFRICGSRSCPDAIQTDCIQWTAEIEKQIPSIVIEARVGQQPAANMRVLVDNQPMPALDNGHAARVNPGQHIVRVEVPPYEPKELSVIVSEGQRYQSIRFEFGNSAASSQRQSGALSPGGAQPHTTQVTRSRPVPVLTWVLGGVGVLGAGGFALLGLWGESKQKDLDRQCSPNCSKDDVDVVRRRYRLADVSLAVGAAAFVGAGVVYLTRPTKEQVVTVGVTPTLGGGGLYLQWNHF